MTIVEAIQNGDVQGVTGLIEGDPELARGRTAEGVSYISLAMYHRQPKIAELLASKRPDLDFPEACAVGSVDRVRQLIADDPEVVNRFSADGFAPVALAAYFGYPDLVEELLAAGADVNAQARNPMKVAAIHAAVSRRDARCVEILLNKGADPNLPQQDGITPLTVAVTNKDEAIIKLLTAAGAH
jgi:uncharacterized protein